MCSPAESTQPVHSAAGGNPRSGPRLDGSVAHRPPGQAVCAHGLANWSLRFKAEAEEALRSTGTPTVIFRCDHIYGPPDEPGPTASAFVAKRGSIMLLGGGNQQLAPLYRDDVVEAILHAALETETPIGTFQLAGPDVMSAEQFVRLLNSDSIRIRRTPATLARLLGHVVPTLTPELVDIMLGNAVPTEDVAATARRFGVELHHLADVWRSQ